MRITQGATRTRGGLHSFSDTLAQWFPVPRILTPPAAGIDISDASIKWFAFDPRGRDRHVHAYGELPLPEGAVEGGVVRDVQTLARALATVKDELGGITAAHAALPEEGAYVFSMHVPPGTSREQTLKIIEFEFEGRVPIPPSAAVYDYYRIPTTTASEEEIAVEVFPRDIAVEYATAFDVAGITLLSLEIEARSIARAVTTGESDEPITLIVDFGRERTGFAVVKRGIPIFTSTVDVGGNTITRMLMEKMSLGFEEAENYKSAEGLIASSVPSKGVEAISGTASALADEIARHYHYWDTRRNEHGERMTPVGRVLLVGGNVNLRGLAGYISSRVQAPTERGDVWKRVASFDDYIPPIDRKQSYQYATAIGLALRGK